MSLHLTPNQLCQATVGRLFVADGGHVDGDAAVDGRVVIDSRQVRSGDVFWALPGTLRDGNNFVDDARQRGAAGVVTQNNNHLPDSNCWTIEVDDSQRALADLARWSRNRFSGQVVAVAGSVGKTTARQMLETVVGWNLSAASLCHQHPRHGLPLSLLDLDGGLDCAFLELNNDGTRLQPSAVEMCSPHIGVVTRVEPVGSESNHEAVIRQSRELLAALPEDGLAVLNGDDPSLRRLAEGCQAEVLFVGRGKDCDLCATHIESGGGQLAFMLDGVRFRIPVWGRHHLTSALCAVAVGRRLGIDLDACAAALVSVTSLPMRCQVARVRGVHIIDDTYNASTTAMHAALELLKDFDTPGDRIVFCGDLREPGTDATLRHRQFGRQVVTRCGADWLLAYGPQAEDLVVGARQAGMTPHRTEVCHTAEEAIGRLREELEPRDVVLMKGIRGIRIEQLLEALEAPASVPMYLKAA